MLTTTSEKVINFLIKSGHELSTDDKDGVREIIWDALTSSYAEGNNRNGCDCGQPSCGYCN